MRPIRLVLDTNIVLDLLHFFDPLTDTLKDALSSPSVIAYTNTSCLQEFIFVINYQKWGFADREKEILLAQYQSLCRNLDEYSDPNAIHEKPSTIPLPKCKDKDDQKFLELARDCSADILVTKDKQLLKLARHKRYPTPFIICHTKDFTEHYNRLLNTQ